MSTPKRGPDFPVGDYEREITIRIKLREIRALGLALSEHYVERRTVVNMRRLFNRVLEAANAAPECDNEKLPRTDPKEFENPVIILEGTIGGSPMPLGRLITLEWVKCTEELPPRGENVLTWNGSVYIGSYDRIRESKTADGVDVSQYAFTDQESMIIEGVTHWRSLPPGPRESP